MANADYVADGRAHAGPALIEPSPYAWRRQAEADLKAARWNLLAWEDPRHPQWAASFRVDMPTVEVRFAEQGRHRGRQALGRVELHRMLKRQKISLGIDMRYLAHYVRYAHQDGHHTKPNGGCHADITFHR